MNERAFSFGENWQSFVAGVDAAAVRLASQDLFEWLGSEGACGKAVIDLGCGSGLSSLAFVMSGARDVLSVDLDSKSIEAAETLRDRAGRPSHWRLTQASALDATFLRSTGQWDIVYSWGVLHHTGALWSALDNASSLVAPGGRLWISIYAKGPRYLEDLALKRRYNRASYLGKKYLEYRWVGRLMRDRWKFGQNPFTWNQRVARGMDVWHDIVDWLGGLPYEVATTDEVTAFCEQRGLVVERIRELSEGACSQYLFRRPMAGGQ
jgi:SAM-dependent methyltransferase